MENKLIIKTAKDVLKTELNGVQKISKILNTDFSNIINKNDYIMIKGSNATGLNKLSKTIISGHKHAL